MADSLSPEKQIICRWPEERCNCRECQRKALDARWCGAIWWGTKQQAAAVRAEVEEFEDDSHPEAAVEAAGPECGA